jgi:hypothetical protein
MGFKFVISLLVLTLLSGAGPNRRCAGIDSPEKRR